MRPSRRPVGSGLFVIGVVVSALVACTGVGADTWGLLTGLSLTEDRNHDGRPDVWRTYDELGRLVEVARDTNFDGRSDQHEYYDAHGSLIRLELDRNFDDRVDVVEEFDPTSHERRQSVVDIDFDGTADLLVLFQHGQPVFSRWISSWLDRKPAAPIGAAPEPARPAGFVARAAAARAGTNEEGPLAPLSSPFDSDPAWQGPLTYAVWFQAAAVSATARLIPVSATLTPLSVASAGPRPVDSAAYSCACARAATRGPPTPTSPL